VGQKACYCCGLKKERKEREIRWAEGKAWAAVEFKERREEGKVLDLNFLHLS
jgi:ribosomal protein L37E